MMRTNTLSKLSLIISIVAIGFSAYTWWVSSKSILNISIERNFSPVSLVKTSSELYPVVLRQKKTLYFSNVGNVSTSIKRASIWVAHPISLEVNDSDMFLKNLGSYVMKPETSKLSDTDIFYDKKGNEIGFPLEIKSKEILKVNIEINIPIGKSIWNDVSVNIHDEDHVEYGDTIPIRRYFEVLSDEYVFFILRIEKEDNSIISIPFNPFKSLLYREDLFKRMKQHFSFFI